MQNITGRSAPKRPCTAWALANSGLMSPVGPEVAAYERHTPVGLITRGWGSGDRTRPKNSTRNNVEQTWPRFRVVWSIRRESVYCYDWKHTRFRIIEACDDLAYDPK